MHAFKIARVFTTAEISAASYAQGREGEQKNHDITDLYFSPKSSTLAVNLSANSLKSVLMS